MSLLLRRNQHCPTSECIIFLKILFIYLLERGGKREKEERIINVWLPLVCPLLGCGPQLRHVPWPGIKPVTLWFSSWHSIHWATPVRVECIIFFNHIQPSYYVSSLHSITYGLHYSFFFIMLLTFPCPICSGCAPWGQELDLIVRAYFPL